MANDNVRIGDSARLLAISCTGEPARLVVGGSASSRISAVPSARLAVIQPTGSCSPNTTTRIRCVKFGMRRVSTAWKRAPSFSCVVARDSCSADTRTLIATSVSYVGRALRCMVGSRCPPMAPAWCIHTHPYTSAWPSSTTHARRPSASSCVVSTRTRADGRSCPMRCECGEHPAVAASAVASIAARTCIRGLAFSTMSLLTSRGAPASNLPSSAAVLGRTAVRSTSDATSDARRGVRDLNVAPAVRGTAAAKPNGLLPLVLPLHDREEKPPPPRDEEQLLRDEELPLALADALPSPLLLPLALVDTLPSPLLLLLGV